MLTAWKEDRTAGPFLRHNSGTSQFCCPPKIDLNVWIKLGFISTLLVTPFGEGRRTAPGGNSFAGYLSLSIDFGLEHLPLLPHLREVVDAMGNAQPGRALQNENEQNAEQAERHPAGQGSSGAKRPMSIKASGRRAQKLQQYSSLTMSKLRSQASSSPTTETTGTGTTTTGPTTTGPTTTDPTTNTTAPAVTTSQVEVQKQPEVGLPLSTLKLATKAKG